MKVFSMFDGVGGFIVGLNNADSTFFQTLYSNQYEPSKKIKMLMKLAVINSLILNTFQQMFLLFQMKNFLKCEIMV